MGAAVPWTVIREAVVAGETRRFSFPNAIALQIRGPEFVPGLVLRFVEDVVPGPETEWTLDAPGVLIPWGGAGVAEITFPDTLTDSAPETVTIIAYRRAALDTLPAIASHAAARNYQEVDLIAEAFDQSIPIGKTVIYTSTDLARTVGVPELRRFSTILGYVNVDASSLVVPGEWNLVLEAEMAGTFVEVARHRANRAQQWVATILAPAGQTHQVHQVVLPIPLGPHRLSIWNADAGLTDEVSYSLWRTTGLLQRSNF